MAELRPFRALRYDPGKIRLADVVTQPYDKITPAMQARYYEQDPANFIRFELAKAQDPYREAKDFLSKMRREGLIRAEERPALYLYEQDFTPPGENQRRLSRRALIALGRLYDYEDGVIFRHEQTLTGPKRDRQELLRTTRVQSGLLFLMYDDAARLIEQLAMPGAVEFVDDLGIRQRLSTVTDEKTVRSITQHFRETPLFIADGHHRYETALGFRRSREGKFAEDFAMMALVNMRSDGLLVLPTHRAIFDVAVERMRNSIERLEKELGMQRMDARDPAAMLNVLRDPDQQDFVSVLATPDAAYRLKVKRSELERRFPGRPFELDVEALHSLLDSVLGITPADVTAQKHVRYHRYIEDALNDVAHGAQAAFLIRPVPVEIIRDRSLRGALMPQKSTDFYPKMNSGLTLYSWDESFVAPEGA